ncbi:MAG: tRNA pseudouridine(55) synthase TruB [Dehalococcoidia bacterium]|nr:tRNA pseudouridine(55) synthase TruB [Dehalococcoidia bacterium]
MARGRDEGPAGILLVDKAQGWTSHDVVAKARGICRQRRMGHTGTLDPMATGLLVLCLGRATRLVEYITAHDKQYEGVIRLGETTDTDDAEGTVVATAPVPALDDGVLRELERRFTGVLMQRPPAYSAVKVEGQRAYAVARRGGAVELAERPVRVDRMSLAVTGPGEVRISVTCGPGTYIRSLARDVGAALGCGAHLSALRRTRSGRFSVEEAVSLDELERIVRAGALEDVLRAPDEGLASEPAAILSEEHGGQLLHGGTCRTEPPGEPPIEVVRVYDAGGRFLAVGRLDAAGTVSPVKVVGPIPGFD